MKSVVKPISAGFVATGVRLGISARVGNLTFLSCELPLAPLPLAPLELDPLVIGRWDDPAALRMAHSY